MNAALKLLLENKMTQAAGTFNVAKTTNVNTGHTSNAQTKKISIVLFVTCKNKIWIKMCILISKCLFFNILYYLDRKI